MWCHGKCTCQVMVCMGKRGPIAPSVTAVQGAFDLIPTHFRPSPLHWKSKGGRLDGGVSGEGNHGAKGKKGFAAAIEVITMRIWLTFTQDDFN